jgi:hypothetical protein
MVDPIVSYIGVESGNMVSHKRFLALFAGGMLPLISLSFLHMLVKFEESGKNKVTSVEEVDIDKLSKDAGKKEGDLLNEEPEKINPTPEDLEKLEDVLQHITSNKFSVLTEEEDENTTQPEKKVLRYTGRNG